MVASAGGVGSGAEGAESASASAAPPEDPTRCWRQSTNWPSSLSDTSCIIRAPNCAGLPVIARSVLTSTVEAPSPAGLNDMDTVAPAVPLPRLSLPLASSRMVWEASSRSRI